MFDQAVDWHRKTSFAPSPNSERLHVLYRCALERGQRGQFWSVLTRQSRTLFDLRSVEANCRVHACSDASRKTVPIDQICGSGGRVGDFDRDFNPLRSCTRQRWLGIAAARERGKALPPVALVKLGDFYFVQDGHHRISVARALGQRAIEATVTVWQVEGPLPWDSPARTPSRGPLDLPFEDNRALRRLRREGAKLQERTLLSFRHLLGALGMALRDPLTSQPGVDRA